MEKGKRRTMNRVLSSCLLVAFAALLFACVPAHAGEPTAEETKDFIVRKATFEDQPNYTKHEISFENDTFVSVATSGILTTTSGCAFTYKVNLAYLNPKRITLRHQQRTDSTPGPDVICLFTTNGDKKVRCDLNVGGKVTTDYCAAFPIEVPEGKTARQIVAALEHLITLSGGKAELFEDK
jgi:hypothetical protein